MRFLSLFFFQKCRRNHIKILKARPTAGEGLKKQSTSSCCCGVDVASAPIHSIPSNERHLEDAMSSSTSRQKHQKNKKKRKTREHAESSARYPINMAQPSRCIESWKMRPNGAAHNTMHLDLPLPPPRPYLCESRPPPPTSPLLVRVRPLEPAAGREACWRCRRRILTTS